eukprot:TRINITY_DN18_c0_g1_i3.p1 TRINITY_DN18_c0_g1~~TRINITY_DN18_c0_g1_i3.p1  ORF type:complete len:192 (+),score=37.32 TRINITY_DN18_c0_g1_i3:49-576(+)
MATATNAVATLVPIPKSQQAPRAATIGCSSSFILGNPLIAAASATHGTSSAAGVSRAPTLSVKAAAAASAQVAAKQKIRVKLRAYSVPDIEEASRMIVEAAASTGANVMGPVRLPTHRRIYCVLRSPHVDKDSREHFEIRTHKRLLDLLNPTAPTIDALMALDLPYGVDLRVTLV